MSSGPALRAAADLAYPKLEYTADPGRSALQATR
jgi:hypothetical protein